MTNVTPFKPARDSEEWQLRVDLAAAFRLTVEMNWHEIGRQSFQRRRLRRRQEIPDEPEMAALLHHPGQRPAAARRQRPGNHEARRCAGRLRLGDPWRYPCQRRPCARACCICIRPMRPRCADWPIRRSSRSTRTPRASTTASPSIWLHRHRRRHREGKRLARMLGNRSTMLMGNHGVLVAADMSRKPWKICISWSAPPDPGAGLFHRPEAQHHEPDLAESTARDWDDYSDSAFAHFEQLKRQLDKKDPSYKE